MTAGITVLGAAPITIRSAAGHTLDLACGGCGLVHRFRFGIPAGLELKVTADVYPMAQLTAAHREALNDEAPAR